jgi:hypothetical protein
MHVSGVFDAGAPVTPAPSDNKRLWDVSQETLNARSDHRLHGRNAERSFWPTDKKNGRTVVGPQTPFTLIRDSLDWAASDFTDWPKRWP